MCNYFKSERKQFLTPYFYKKPNIIKFKKLLSTENKFIQFCKNNNDFFFQVLQINIAHFSLHNLVETSLLFNPILSDNISLL